MIRCDAVTWMASIPVLGYAVFSLYRIVNTVAPDFSVYYYSAKNLVNGVNMYRTPVNLYTGLGYPPYSLLFYIPLTVFPYQAAQAAFTILSFLAFLGSVVLAVRIYLPGSLTRYLAVCVLMFLAFPTRFTLGMGQVNLIVLFLLLAAIRAERTPVSVLFLTISVMLKPQILFILPFLFMTGKRDTVALSCVIMVLLAGLTVGVFGTDIFLTYLSRTVPQLITFHERGIYYNQGIGAVFSRFLPDTAAAIATYVSSSLVYTVTFITLIRKRTSPAATLAIALAALLLIEPLSWQHHYVFLLPLFLYVLSGGKRTAVRVLALSASYVMISWNLKKPDDIGFGAFGDIIRSHVFIGTAELFLMGMHADKTAGSR